MPTSFIQPRHESFQTNVTNVSAYTTRSDAFSTVTDFSKIDKKKSKGGIWKGYYEQHGTQHPMTLKNFKAKVKEGTVKGKGRDEIGEFKIKGKVHHNGGVDFKKEYKGRHTVVYMGTLTENRLIEGEWEVSGARGNFKLEVSKYKNLITI